MVVDVPVVDSNIGSPEELKRPVVIITGCKDHGRAEGDGDATLWYDQNECRALMRRRTFGGVRTERTRVGDRGRVGGHVGRDTTTRVTRTGRSEVSPVAGVETGGVGVTSRSSPVVTGCGGGTVGGTGPLDLYYGDVVNEYGRFTKYTPLLVFLV